MEQLLGEEKWALFLGLHVEEELIWGKLNYTVLEEMPLVGSQLPC